MSEALNQPPEKKQSGFFQILKAWLILSIIVLLGFFLYRCSSHMMQRTDNNIVRSVMKDLQVATGHFKAEYTAFPIPVQSADKDVELRSEGSLIAALIAEEPSLNPKNIKFVDLPLARQGMNGLIQEAGQWRLVDRWGEMYYIFLDTNLDNRIVNPDPGNRKSSLPWVKAPSPPPPFLNSSTAIYSSGPDRDPKTWEDNICSWR